MLDDTVARTGGKSTDQYGAVKGAADSLLEQNQQNKIKDPLTITQSKQMVIMLF